MFSEPIANFLISHLGQVTYLVLAVALFSAIPLALLGSFIWLLANRRGTADHGLALGFAVAAWASICWLIVPYCGGYANLPWLVPLLMFDPPVDTFGEELFVHAMNFVVWPLLGWLLFRCKVRLVGR